MDPSYLSLDLSSVDTLLVSLKELEESMPRVDNRVHLHHGASSVAIRGKSMSNGINGTIKRAKTLVDLMREEWRPYESPFPAHPLLRTGNLQSIYAAVSNFNDVDRVFYARKLLTMEDGGTVGLDIVLESEAQFSKGRKLDEAILQRPDYVKNLPPRIRYMQPNEEDEVLRGDDNRPMLITLHGLSGGSHESYLRAVLNHMRNSKIDWACASLNARGCGRTNVTTKQLFCANWTG